MPLHLTPSEEAAAAEARARHSPWWLWLLFGIYTLAMILCVIWSMIPCFRLYDGIGRWTWERMLQWVLKLTASADRNESFDGGGVNDAAKREQENAGGKEIGGRQLGRYSLARARSESDTSVLRIGAEEDRRYAGEWKRDGKGIELENLRLEGEKSSTVGRGNKKDEESDLEGDDKEDIWGTKSGLTSSCERGQIMNMGDKGWRRLE